jgi:hypothetical protein
MRDTKELTLEAGIDAWWDSGSDWRETFNEHLKAFADLVRADERDACAELVYNSPPSDEYESQLKAVYDAIRSRGNT